MYSKKHCKVNCFAEWLFLFYLSRELKQHIMKDPSVEPGASACSLFSY